MHLSAKRIIDFRREANLFIDNSLDAEIGHYQYYHPAEYLKNDRMRIFTYDSLASARDQHKCKANWKNESIDRAGPDQQSYGLSDK